VTPGVRHLCAVPVWRMVEWLRSIPFEECPQQHPLGDGQLRPAMVNDLGWPGGGRGPDPRPSFREAMAAVVLHVGARIESPGWSRALRFENHMLSVVMPGHSIDPHPDLMGPGWQTRVHVPLTTNPSAVMRFPNDTSRLMSAGREWNLQVGEAYLVDVSHVHEVRNGGTTPRVHFMFDVFEGP